MSRYDEPELDHGTRQWDHTQEIFRGSPDPSRDPVFTSASWYDTSIDANDGAFAMIQAGSDLDEDGADLVGEILRVSYRGRTIFVYCVGGAELATDFALSRAAFLRLGALWKDEINNVLVEVCKVGEIAFS